MASIHIAVLFVAYLLGSVPSAVIISRRAARVDIRELGDRNMGARNVSRNLGWKAGAMVAVMDVGKGALAVLFANSLGMDLSWRIATAFFVVLGHDFPMFAGFRGGQGFATTVGVLLVLAPRETLPGLLVYACIYLITRHADLSAGIGIGLVVLLMVLLGLPTRLLAGTLILILSIPAKMLLDRPRRAEESAT